MRAEPVNTYPSFVNTPEQKRRFDLALDRAAELFELDRDSGLTRQHAISIYRSDIPSGDSGEHPAPRPDQQGGPVSETESETPAEPAEPGDGEEGEGSDGDGNGGDAGEPSE